MDDFQKIAIRSHVTLFLTLLIDSVLSVAAWLAIQYYTSASLQPVLLAVGLVVALLLSWLAAGLLSSWLLMPLKYIWKSVLFLSPNASESRPKQNELRLGRDMILKLNSEIYSLVSTNKEDSSDEIEGKLDFICKNLPLPLLVLDANDNLKYANNNACKYLGVEPIGLVGKNINDVLDMSFAKDVTFEDWLKQAQEKAATSTKSWDHVKLNRPDGEPMFFDLAAYYNRGNVHGFETILVLFDETDRYASEEDQAGFVALAVHELRNPLTMLRGYIEILEEEVDDKTNLELTTDLQKMKASAKLLSEYTNNILNVSRVDSDQLTLKLKADNWKALITDVVESMRLRAQVHGLSINLSVAEKLPEVGVDRVSISEVLTNLIDNAIKYNKSTEPIQVHSYLNQAGDIETTVTNFGSVIGQDIIGNLFQRFYRSHRSRSSAGGTGLGLYLSKALVGAHGGNIWVKSSEEEGTTFGFTVLPFSKLKGAENDQKEITRMPHGWIKNHSLYRR